MNDFIDLGYFFFQMLSSLLNQDAEDQHEDETYDVED